MDHKVLVPDNELEVKKLNLKEVILSLNGMAKTALPQLSNRLRAARVEIIGKVDTSSPSPSPSSVPDNPDESFYEQLSSILDSIEHFEEEVNKNLVALESHISI